MTTPNRPYPRKSSKRSSSRRKRQLSSFLFLLMGAVIACIFVGVTGFALFRGGYVPFGLSSSLTGTAIAQNNASCQMLIDRAIQASGGYCGETNSNKVCYGNTTIKAELVPNATQRFSERGDIITVKDLRRLSASPLKLETNEWGIAVFKLIANLPRSLPGETVTMLVFGNATLDNNSEESDSLESFYFSSELGQISCEKVPFDGLMINSPEGSGIQFKINGAELTIIGSASIKAIKNGEMEVSLYTGSGKIVSNGEEQYFGAGQKVKVQLGGDNGNQSVSTPSEPDILTQDEFDIACTLTGQFCSEDEITPVSEEEAQGQIQSEITSTPTLSPTPTLTGIPTITVEPTNTLLVLPSATLSPAPTAIPANTKTPVPTKSPTNKPPSTVTSPPTQTPSAPVVPLCGYVSLTNFTSTSNTLTMDITNNHGKDVSIDGFFAYWPDSPSTQALEFLTLNSDQIWNKNDNTSPSDFPTEGDWRSGSNRVIPNTATRNFVVQFRENLQPSGYEVHIYFNIGCQLIGKK